MNDIPAQIKNLIPNIIIFISSLYIVSKENPLAYLSGVITTIIIAAIIIFTSSWVKKYDRKFRKE